MANRIDRWITRELYHSRIAREKTLMKEGFAIMSKIVDIRHLALLCSAVALALLLGGCREDEQNRVLKFEQGKYLGKSDQPLSSERVDELRQRSRLQGPW